MTIEDHTQATPSPVRTKPAASAGAAARRRAVPGVVAVVVALALGFVGALAVTVAARGEFELATALAQLAIAGTVLTFAAGVVAVVLGRGRRWGIAAVILSIAANPLAQLQILTFLGGVSPA